MLECSKNRTALKLFIVGLMYFNVRGSTGFTLHQFFIFLFVFSILPHEALCALRGTVIRLSVSLSVRPSVSNVKVPWAYRLVGLLQK